MIKTKSGARKIEGTDNWREIFDDHNYTVDALDQLAEDMAIIVNGNKTAYASGAAVGQYVLLRNSTITDRADGMYKAAKAIPYNTTIDKTYLTAVSGGAINSLSDHITTLHSTNNVTCTNMSTGSARYNSEAKYVLGWIAFANMTFPKGWTNNVGVISPTPVSSVHGIICDGYGNEGAFGFYEIKSDGQINLYSYKACTAIPELQLAYATA